jgi:hypothetical protein
MPAGPIGSVWESGTWPDTAWELGSWGEAEDAVLPPERLRMARVMVKASRISNVDCVASRMARVRVER